MTAGLLGVLLSTDAGFSHRVHLLDGAGRGLRRLTDRRASGRPAFSPDGTRLVFPGPLTDDSEGRYCLYEINVDGSGLRRTTSPRVADADPAWSPDGRTIAFVRDPEGAMDPSRWRLMTMPAGGGAQAERVSTPGAREPAWSPDGKSIAFVAFGRIYVVGSDGNGLRAVTDSGAGARSPVWSADGTTIAFVQRLSPTRSRVAAVPSGGGAYYTLADLAAQAEDPVYTADGSTVQFLSFTGEGWEGRRDTAIWRATSGGQPQLVVRFATPAVRLAHFADPPPGPVTALAPTEVKQRTVRLRWTNPTDDDFTVVEIRMVVGSEPPQTVEAGVAVYVGRTPDALIEGLEPMTTYSFSVFARDRGGNASAPASTTISTPPPAVPDPPAYVEAVPGAAAARVSWTAPLNDGGRPILGYTVTATGQGQSVEVGPETRSVVLQSLRSGEPHVFAVVARNELGPSAPGVSQTVVPDTGAVAGTYHALAPRRLVDTRSTGRRIASGTDLVVPVAGRAGVPSQGAAAVVLTLVATEPTGSGFLAAFPAGTPRPVISTLNFVARQTVANLDVVRLGGGAIALGAGAAAAHAVADVGGWYADATGQPGGRMNALSPTRVLDTRLPGSAAVGPGGTLLVRLTGVGGVPASGVSSVVLVLTAVSPSASTYLSVHPADEARPVASAINAARGETVAVLVVARLSADGRIAIFNHAGSAHVAADVLGYHTARAADPGELYVPLAPSRVLDTRSGMGAARGAVGPEGVVVLDLHDRSGIPASARTVLLNVTATGASQVTHISVYPGDRRAPQASALNVTRGRTVANLVLAKLSRDGRVALRNNAGTVHLVADVRGYYAP